MADRLHRLLQNPQSAPHVPISLEPSVLDSSDKGNGVIAARSTRKQLKKVHFSPENQTFVFEASSHTTVGRMTRRRKSCVPSVDGQTEVSRNDEGMKKRNVKFSVRVTRSKAAVVMESDDVNVDLPIASKKRRRPKKVEKSTHEQSDKSTENVSVKTDKVPGRSVQRQLRSSQVTVLEDTDLVENPQKKPRRSARQEIQPAQQNIEAKGTTTAPSRKSVISKNEEAGNGERIGVFETEKATKADGRQGPSTRRRQTLMVTSSSTASADLDIQKSIEEVKKGREAVMGSSSSSVVAFVEDETHVGKETKDLKKKKRKWIAGTGAGHLDEVLRRSSRTASVNISNMKVGVVLKATENQKGSDEHRVRELEDEVPGGKNLSLAASATATITRTLNSNSLDKAPEFTAKHCNKQVRRSARMAPMSSSDVSVDPMAKASEKESATECWSGDLVRRSSSMLVRRSGRNTSESTLHVSVAPFTEASETNRSGECRMERTEEEGPLTRHRRTQIHTSNSQPVIELDIQNSITRLQKQKKPSSNKESDVTWLQNEINSNGSLMAASTKDGISVVGQHMKLTTKRKAARRTRRDTVYKKMVRSSRSTALASTRDVSVVPVAEASASGRRMAKTQEEVLGDEKLVLPAKVGEGNFTSAVYGSADINSSHGVLEFSDGSHGSKQVRRSARKALISSSDALISPVKRTSAKKEESEFITCIEKEKPVIVSPPLENIKNSGSEAWESSDKDYSNKEVRSSARIASLSSSGALIAQTKRSSAKKRGSEPRRTSTEEITLETKSPLLPEKTTERSSGALEHPDKGCNDKQVKWHAGMASARASDASIGPVTRASGKKRESESRIIGIQEEGLGIKSPSFPEKIIDSSCGSLEFSDRGYSSKQVKRSARLASSTLIDASSCPKTRASGKKRESESSIIGTEEEGLGIKSPSLPEKIIDSSCGALEFSDRGYSSKQVKRSTRLTSSTLLDASNGPKTRASGKKRESKSRISSIKEKAPRIQSPLLNKMKDSSYGILEFSGKGHSSKQVRRSARVTSVTSSVDASVGPTLSAFGKRESECAIGNIEKETPDIESPLLGKIADSISGALGFSDEVYSSKHGRRSARVTSITSGDESIGLVKRASGEKRESESRVTGIAEETPAIGSLPLLVKTDSSNEALEFSDKGFRKKVRRSEQLESLSPSDASISPMIIVSGNTTESRTASKNEGNPGSQSVLLLKEMSNSKVELVTLNSGRPAQLLDSNSGGGTLDISGKSGRKTVSIDEEDSGSADSKGCKSKQLGNCSSDAYSSPLHASVSPLGETEALEASRGSDRGMASVEEEAQCSGSLSLPDKTADEKVELAAADSAMITRNLGSNRSGEAPGFSGRTVYNMTEGLMTGYDTHGQLEIAEGEKDSAHADTLGSSDGNASFSALGTAAGEMALENNKSKDVITAMAEETQCIELADTVQIEIICQADGSPSAQTESPGLQLEVPPGNESMNSKCNLMGSKDGTASVEGGQQVITESIDRTDDEITREDTDEASGFCESRVDLKERSLLFASFPEITEKPSVVHNSLIFTGEPCEGNEEELACSTNNDERLAAPSKQTSESQDVLRVTKSAMNNEACLNRMKQAGILTEENKIITSLEYPISQSLASDMTFHEGNEGENLSHDARNEDKLLLQATNVNYEVEGNDMHGDTGKSDIQYGVVEIADSLVCDAKDKSEPLDFILEIQECKDVNEESRAESAGKSDVQDGAVEIVDSLEFDAKDKSESLETFIYEIQECKDVNEESRADSSMELDGLLKTKAMSSDDLSLNKEEDNFFQFSNVKDFDTSDQSAQPCNSSCPLKKNIMLAESERDGIMNFELHADAEDDVLPAQSVELMSLKECKPSSLAAELIQENRNPQESSCETSDTERDLTDEVTSANSSEKEQIASPGISKGGEKQEAVISSRFSFPVMQNMITKPPCSTINCDKTITTQSSHGAESRVESCGWEARALSSTEGIYNVTVEEIEQDEMLEAHKDQVMTDDVVSHKVLQNQIFTRNIHDGSSNTDKNVGNDNEAEHIEDKFSSGETKEKFFFDHTVRGFEGPTLEEEWNDDGIKTSFITNEGNYHLNVDEAKGEMLETDGECVIGSDMIPNVAHDPDMSLQEVYTEDGNGDTSLGVTFSEFKGHQGTLGVKDADKHSTEKCPYLFPERELKGQISGHVSYTMLETGSDEKMLEADKECAIGSDMIHDVAHDPDMLVQEVCSEAENGDTSLELRFSKFRDHQGTAGLGDANKHSTEKGPYLFAERELKERISGHISDTMLESDNDENLEHHSANLQMAVDHSAVSSTIYTTEEEHDTHDEWLDIAFTLFKEDDKDSGSKVRVTDAATPAVICGEPGEVPKTSGHCDEMGKNTEEDIKPDNSTADQTGKSYSIPTKTK